MSNKKEKNLGNIAADAIAIDNVGLTRSLQTNYSELIFSAATSLTNGHKHPSRIQLSISTKTKYPNAYPTPFFFSRTRSSQAPAVSPEWQTSKASQNHPPWPALEILEIEDPIVSSSRVTLLFRKKAKWHSSFAFLSRPPSSSFQKGETQSGLTSFSSARCAPKSLPAPSISRWRLPPSPSPPSFDAPFFGLVVPGGGEGSLARPFIVISLVYRI